MKIILFGAPGAGKGTIADEIAKIYGYRKISTGDLIRNAIKSGSALGEKLRAITERGELVDDLTVVEIVKSFLAAPANRSAGFIFDGFPRTLMQARELSTIDPQAGEISFLLRVDRDLVVRRLTSRLTCSSCSAIFNTITNPPMNEAVCDLCGGKLVRRGDDNEKTILNRIDVYLKETAPVIEYYRKASKLIEIDGAGTVSDVFLRLKEYLDDFVKN